MQLYIDATSGGMALQVILSGFVGGIVFLKVFWRNLTSPLRRSDRDKSAPETAEATADATSSYTTDTTAS
jgi:hypothetical protein